MPHIATTLLQHRELIWALAIKTITLRYKQAYLGVLWTILRPVMLVLIFMLVRAFVGIDSGDIPYPILTFAALMPWMLFQEATTDAVSSIVNNATLIRKIYFPREVFPLTAVVTKLIEFAISICVLVALMLYYHVPPTIHLLWVPLIVAYVVLVSLTIGFAGAALYVYSRDIGSILPVALSLLMYASPVMYPLALVKRKLLDERLAGDWSEFLYTVYTANPLAGIIDAFQRTVLVGTAPDFGALIAGAVLIVTCLPLSYILFKNAEGYFADSV